MHKISSSTILTVMGITLTCMLSICTFAAVKQHTYSGLQSMHHVSAIHTAIDNEPTLNSENASSIFFNEDIHAKVEKTGLMDKYKTTMFEIDSNAPNSELVEKVKNELAENSLLHQGTWAYLGDTRLGYKKTYLFWTSYDTEAIGAGQKIPVIISAKDGKFVVSETTTALRTTKDGKTYTAIADHISSPYGKNGFSSYIKGRKTYDTMEEAYHAYEAVLKNYA